MSVRASVNRDADGRWNFEGDTARPDNADGGASGGASGAIIDMRWSDELGGIETTTDGVNWVLKIPFVAYDA